MNTAMWYGLGALGLGVMVAVVLGAQRWEHWRQAKVKGVGGESELTKVLREMGVPREQIFRNVYLPSRRGTTEIDLIVLSKKGIFVFECKHYAGCVCGDGRGRKWVQVMGKKKYYFLSPIIQNWNHRYWVQRYFRKIEGVPVIPFVVMNGKAEWRLSNISANDHVLKPGEFKRVYDKLPNSRATVRHFNYIKAELKRRERPRRGVRRAHVKRARKVMK